MPVLLLCGRGSPSEFGSGKMSISTVATDTTYVVDLYVWPSATVFVPAVCNLRFDESECRKGTYLSIRVVVAGMLW